MAITGGFGMTVDLERGTSRQWVMGRDGVNRWSDNGEPCEQMSLPDRLRAWIPNGDGHNSDYANTLAEAADEIDRLRGALITVASLLEQGCNSSDMASSMRRAAVRSNVELRGDASRRPS
jgi:hypothetical protein